MKREYFNIEFVEDDFSLAKKENCPNCGSWICFLPVIKGIVKKECKKMIDLLKKTGIKVKSVDRITVKEWTCKSCNTIYVNIQDKKIIFDNE